MTKNEHGVKVGDYFVCSWGYDQTNVDFYKVVGVTAKGVKVQAWQSKTVDGRVVAGEEPKTNTKTTLTPDEFYEADYWTRKENSVEVPAPVKFHRTRDWSSEPTFTVNSYSNAYLWDGAPKYETHAAGQPGH